MQPWGPGPQQQASTPAAPAPSALLNQQQPVYSTPSTYPSSSDSSNDGVNSNSSNNLIDITAKVNRLSEMGFSRENVQQALLANSGDENAALNSLLAGDAVIVP